MKVSYWFSLKSQLIDSKNIKIGHGHKKLNADI